MRCFKLKMQGICYELCLFGGRFNGGGLFLNRRFLCCGFLCRRLFCRRFLFYGRNDFTLDGVSNLRLDGFSGFTADMTITSTAAVGVKIVGGELEVNYRGQKGATLTLENDVRIRRNRTQTVGVEVGIRLHNPLTAMAALAAASTNPEQVTISGYGEAKVGPFRKRMVRENVPISKFIAIFGDISNYI